jgi:serine/threonine protein kinase
VLIFDMLVGCTPFVNDSLSCMFERILAAQYTPPLSLPMEAAAVVDEFLQVEPLKRLGATPASMPKIETHPFFTGLPWDSVRSQIFPSPLAHTVPLVRVSGKKVFLLCTVLTPTST